MRLVLLALLVTSLRADLTQVQAEANLERRSRSALDHAEQTLKTARQAYDHGDLKATEAALAEVKEAVDLADASLKATGKSPRKSPKYFKHAEIKTRQLLKKLDALARDMNEIGRASCRERV